MWTHFGHFVGAVIATFFDAIGTTALGRAVDIAFASSVAFVVLRRRRREDGWKQMLDHWRSEYKAGVKFALLSAAIIYSPVAIWSVAKAVWTDHDGLSRRIVRIQHALDDNTKASGSQIAELTTQCKIKEGINQTLEKQNRDEQLLIGGCQTQALKLLTPEPFKMTTMALALSSSGPPDTKTARWLLLSNKIVSPTTIDFACDSTIEQGSTIAPIGSAYMGGTGNITTGIWRTVIQSPAWSPGLPLLATVIYRGNKEDLVCNFNPH